MRELRKFKIVYWSNGMKKIVNIEACSKYEAKMKFYMNHPREDIVRIEEVTEDAV